MNDRTRTFLILIGLNVLWTPVNLVVRAATQDGMSPAAVGLARWALLAVVLHGLLRIPAFAKLCRLKWPRGRDRWFAAAIGTFLFAPAHLLYYVGLTRGASTVGGTVLNATAPIWVAALAFVFLRERATPVRLLSIALGFVGAWIVVCGFGVPNFSGDGIGSFLYLMGVICESAATVLGTSIVRRSSGVGFLACEVAGMVPTFVLVPLVLNQFLPLQAHGVGIASAVAVGYLVLFPGLICFGTWFATVERVPLSTMVVTILLQPPLSAFLAWRFMGETIGLPVGVGTGLIVAALAVAAAEKTEQPAHAN